ncbi:glycosyltransferase family 4 protein [Olivibacter ginsenosidimutans]|uniref:Glycosyltransferase family 4 protein n=1 Tax=Olivibacter ginsenosidimutans TaxID=1176537 RepID=A0ABP9AYV7_9SPHI
MKVVYIGTYVPRECGIGTFTKNLLRSTKQIIYETPVESIVVALNDAENISDYPDEVKFIINQDQQEDYIQAADFINNNGVDCCILEHEYGIFGGQSGLYILPLLHRLKVPIVVTFHTVLERPSYNEKAVLIAISKMANAIVVMSNKAIRLLQRIYHVSVEKIFCIDHGVPTFNKSQVAAKEELQLTGKRVLLTFGFLGRNKGIETVIKSLVEVVKRFPDTLYVVLGKTHPNVLRHSGEEYRNYLKQLVTELGLNHHVLFINEFIAQDILATYLSACDIYITPYINEAQITSGTLSYAIGAGAGVLSTPYWHAKELLKDGRGRLFGFKDVDGLSSLLLELLGDHEKLSELRARALAYGQETTWPKIAAKYLKLYDEIIARAHVHKKDFSEVNINDLPPFSLEHVKRLTNPVGIIQHATYAIPNYKEGYCLDDNARALLLTLMAYQQFNDPDALALIPTYLAYIHYMQKEDGLFRNFMGFDNQFTEAVGSEDAFGRTIWALGYLFAHAPCDGYYQLGRQLFFNAAKHFERLDSIRAIAYTIIGICHYLEHQPNDEGMIERMRALSFRLVNAYENNKTDKWHWYEPLLAYDNAILPLALLQAVKFLNDDTIQTVAMETLDFLEKICLKNGYLSIVGNQQWFYKDQHVSKFGQQPIDVLATVMMFNQAYVLTAKKEYLEKIFVSFKWFLGENDLRITIYDHETKGCCDGLEVYGVNRNQGAESTLAYLISYLTVYKTYNSL